MLAAERHRLILATIRADGVASTDRLARALGVSLETVRRDLVALDRRGTVRRVRGGAALPAALAGEEESYAARQHAATAAKAAIGARAARLVSPGQTVILDVGTTALEVARALPGTFRGTVATCSLRVAAELASRPDLEVLICGGRVRGGDLAVSNATAVAFFDDLRADIAFLGSGGIDARAGLTDFHLDEVATRRAIIDHSARSFALADSSKLGRVAPHRVCALGRLAGVITDGPVPAEVAAALDGAGPSLPAGGR